MRIIPVVVDAGVAAEWVTGGEGESAEGARALLADLRDGRIDAVTPPQFGADVVEMLANDVRRGWLELPIAVKGAELVQSLELRLVELPGGKLVERSLAVGLVAHRAAYVLAAELVDGVLWTADASLARCAGVGRAGLISTYPRRP